jgi:hypothetical protein
MNMTPRSRAVAHVRVELGEAGRPQVVLHGPEREVDDLDVAGDVALNDLEQVARRLLGLVPGIAAQVEQHHSGHQQHAEGREHADGDPGASGAKPAHEAGRDHRRRSQARFSLLG